MARQGNLYGGTRGSSRKTWVLLAAFSIVTTVVAQTGLGLGAPPAAEASDALGVTATASGDGGSDEASDSATWTVRDPSASDEAVVAMISASIDIEKATNGEDADTGPGPQVLAGSPITWTYAVTNTGDVALTEIVVADDDPTVAVSCPRATLDPGMSMTCTASGTAARGRYASLGTVTASASDVDGDPAVVRDDDSSHYVGVRPAITLDKAFEAPELAPGEHSSFTLTVTNTGDIDLSDVLVSDEVDDRLTVTGIVCPGLPGSIGQSVTCSIDSLVPGETVNVIVEFQVAADVVAVATAPTPVAQRASDATCRPEYEPNRDGVCTSISIRPVASCWAPGGTQVIELVNVRSTTQMVHWDYLDQSGKVSAPPGSTFFTLTGGPSGGELRVQWSYDRQAWWIDITAEPCDPAAITIYNTAVATAASAVGPVDDEGSDSVTIIGAAADQAPNADFTVSCVDLECAFTDISSDPDGDITAWQWDLGDGASATGQNPTHEYAAAGVYAVTLTVTDATGLTGSLTREVTVAATMHIGDLDSIAIAGGATWNATVIVTVVDGHGDAVVGAEVDGMWERSGPASCLMPTGTDGRCFVELDGLTISSDRFTVTVVTHPDFQYDPSANTDDDDPPDSDGTTITLRRPVP